MGKMKVLVIDDELIVLDSIRKILEGDKYDVDVSQSGRDGLQKCRRIPYDVVLTDIRMPDLDGMVVLREIKKTSPGLPVIIITGYATVHSAVMAMKLGAADYIEKPFMPEQMLGVIASALRGGATGNAPEQVLVHKEEILKVLDRAVSDREFFTDLLHHWSDALDEYDLSRAEKLALLTGDIEGIEGCTGPLTPNQRSWLEQPLSAELLRTYGW